VSKASSRQETALVIVHASDQTYVVPVYVYGHKHREDIGLIQPDLCVDPDMWLLNMLLQQRHTIPGNTNAPEDLWLTTAVASGAFS